MPKERYEYNCSTLEDLQKAAGRKDELAGSGVHASIYLFCRAHHIRLAPHEKKILIVEQGIFCEKDGLAVARQREPSLSPADFEKRLSPYPGYGVQNFFLYSAPVSV